MSVPIIRTSERRAFKRCVWRWWKGWRQGLVPIGSVSDALWFGTGVHIALAEWYCGPGLKRGPYPAETFTRWAGDEIRFIKTSEHYGSGAKATIEEKMVAAVPLGQAMLEGYLETYGSDDSWWVIEPERTGQVDLADAGGDPLAIYAFTYDLVYRDLTDDSIWLGEHKTAKAITLGHLQLDDQAGSYWAVAGPHLRQAGLIGPKEKLTGIMYNFLRKALPDDRPRNAEGHYCNKPEKADYVAALIADGMSSDGWETKATLKELQENVAHRGLTVLGKPSLNQPKPLFVREPVHRTAKERSVQIERMVNDAVVMDAFRSRQLPLTKNTTRDCQYDCEFFHLCQLDETGTDTREFQAAMYRRADPYAAHRKSTEE